MKAIRVHEFGAPEVMKLEEVPNPKVGSGQVLVGVRAVGVNPVDTYIRAGVYVQPPVPYTPGMDAAGVVEAIGEGVKRVTVGERVYVAGSITGTYAEKTLCEEWQVHPLPEPISFAQGAGVNVPYATAYRAIFQRAAAQPGETVLVHGGSGGVGIAAIQIAYAAGMVVIATAGTEEGRRLVGEQGARHVLDHHDANHWDKLLEITEGRGIDVILEMLANVNLGRDLKVLGMNGRVVVIGSRGALEIDPRDTMRRDITIVGMTLMNVGREELFGIHAALVAGLRMGTLRPIVGKELPLAEAARAHHEIIERRAFGKIVLVPN